MSKSIPSKLMLLPIGTRTVYHFKNAAARRSAGSMARFSPEMLGDAVTRRMINPALLKPVEITIAMHQHVPLTIVRQLRREHKAKLAALKAAMRGTEQAAA